MTGTKKELPTRDYIISKGAELIHAKGFNYTGLNEILQSADVPKGSFYFYFKSKEDFGCAVIDYFSSFVGGIFERYLGDQSVKPMARFENLFQFYTRFFKKNGFTLGCPIGNLSMELADLSTESRIHLSAAIENLITRIETCIKEAAGDKNIPPVADTREAAQYLFYGFEGAILHLKILKNMTPLHVFKKCLFDYLKYSNTMETTNE